MEKYPVLFKTAGFFFSDASFSRDDGPVFASLNAHDGCRCQHALRKPSLVYDGHADRSLVKVVFTLKDKANLTSSRRAPSIRSSSR